MFMKKLMSLVVIASMMMVGCSNNVETMKDNQNKKSMDYEVTTVDGKT